jgi:hypothetical protein
MKASIAILLCGAGALACARTSRPPSTASASPTAPQRVETAQVSESAPPQPGIPSNAPPVAPPTPPVAPPPDQTPLTLTPASGMGGPRTASAQLVPSAQAPGDRADNSQDQESIREIRAAMASDRMLSPVASKVTIVAKKGRVWLRGQVNTSAQRAGIERVTRQAAGVFSVNNELVVME